MKTHLSIVIVAFLLAACEMLEESPSVSRRTGDRPGWTRLTTEQVAERWAIFPGSNRALVGSIRRAASIQDPFEEAGFTIIDARRYGQCDVFSLHLQNTNIHAVVLDCVDRNAAALPGHYHAAITCATDWNLDYDDEWHLTYVYAVVVRAGDQRIYPDGAHVRGTLGNIEHSFLWQAVAEVRDYTSEEQVYRTVEVRWGYHTTFGVENHLQEHYKDLVGSQGGLHFQIGQYGGRVRFLDNDTEALKEYQKRCDEDLLETEPTGPGRGPPGQPGN